MVATLSNLRLFLDLLGAHPKKSLSQNFLVDKNVLEKIVKEANIKEGDCVLEVGSGPGALTEALIAAGARVIAVEKDEVFARELSRFPHIEVFSGDIRDFPLESLKHEKKIKVVSNLPYQLTSLILGLLVPRFDLFSSLTLMVQREVASRMTATVGERECSALTLFLNYYAKVHYAFTVSPRSFFPIPKVDSAVVNLTLQEPDFSVPAAELFPLVKMAFQQRRKMIRASLKACFPSQRIETALKESGVDCQARPENLSFKQWIDFAALLNS